MNRKMLWVAVLVLAALHHDVWYWDDPTLVLGFLPVGLAYHVAYSLAAAGFWALAVQYAWPKELEDLANAMKEGTSKS